MSFPASDILAVATGGFAGTFKKPGVQSVGTGGFGVFGPDVNWTVRTPPNPTAVEQRQAIQSLNRLIIVLRDRIARLDAEFSRTNRRALGEP